MNFNMQYLLWSSFTMVIWAVAGEIDARGGDTPAKLRPAVKVSSASTKPSSIRGSWKVVVLTEDEKVNTMRPTVM
jgi:hypothetical protein